jgi:phosphoglycolate phosphatase (TIGR01487 family)
MAIKLIVSDFDRTFTDETLTVGSGLTEAIARLKKRGTPFSIVSGRSYDFLNGYCGKLDGLVDSFVAENGCIGQFNGKKHVIGDCVDRKAIFESLDRQGVPYGIGEVIFAVDVRNEGELIEALSGTDGSFHVIRNVDSLMILPRNVSKSSGAAWLARMHGVSVDEVAAIGDAENDIHLRDACSLLGAVSNAIPAMKDAADYVCEHGYGKGLQEFLEYIEAGR